MESTLRHWVLLPPPVLSYHLLSRAYDLSPYLTSSNVSPQLPELRPSSLLCLPALDTSLVLFIRGDQSLLINAGMDGNSSPRTQARCDYRSILGPRISSIIHRIIAEYSTQFDYSLAVSPICVEWRQLTRLIQENFLLDGAGSSSGCFPQFLEKLSHNILSHP